MTEPMVIAGVLKWCWSRVQGGVVGWDAYDLFKVGEHGMCNVAPACDLHADLPCHQTPTWLAIPSKHLSPSVSKMAPGNE
jgi:hypothetical protein